jgi:hypothetical protein
MTLNLYSPHERFVERESEYWLAGGNGESKGVEDEGC